jgi:integrase
VTRPATGTARFHRGRWQAGIRAGGLRTWHDVPGLEPVNDAAHKRKAKAWAAWFSAEVRAGRVVLDKAQPAPEPVEQGETFQAWTTRWLEHREQVRGLRATHNDLSALRTHLWSPLGLRPIASITSAEVEAVRDELDAKVREKRLAWKSAINVWGVLTSAFRDAYRSKDKTLRVRTDNPCTDMPGPDRGAKKALQYLYPSEFLRFVTCETVPLRWRRLVTLAIFTGLRAGELRALLWSDVDTRHGVLSVTKSVNRRTGKVTTTKSGRTRRVPLEAELVRLLDAMRGDAAGSDAVTWLPPYDDQATVFRFYLARAGVTRTELLEGTPTSHPLRFHDLRATTLTWWAVRGDDPLKIQSRAGHTDFKTTQRYLREAEALGSSFGTPFPALPDNLLRAEAGEVQAQPAAVPGALQEAILERLRAAGRPLAPGELARSLQRSPQRIHGAVRRLLAKGLVAVTGATHTLRIGLPVDPAIGSQGDSGKVLQRAFGGSARESNRTERAFVAGFMRFSLRCR